MKNEYDIKKKHHREGVAFAGEKSKMEGRRVIGMHTLSQQQYLVWYYSEEAFKLMERDNQNQSIIVSGQSFAAMDALFLFNLKSKL